MDFEVRSGDPITIAMGCVAVGMYADGKLTTEAKKIDTVSGGTLKALVQSGDFSGDTDTSHLLHSLSGIQAERVLLIGLGAADKFDAAAYRRAVAVAVKRMGNAGSADLCLFLPTPKGMVVRASICTAVLSAREVLYSFDEFKTSPKKRTRLKKIVIDGQESDLREAAQGLREGLAIADGADLARDLGNLPANVCTPSYLADQARKMATKQKLTVDVLDRKQMQALGMNTLLSVAAGSHQPPKFIVIKHLKGGAKARPIVLVGKGVTFDTGGISLKPGAEMDEMKYDMCGAASVIGTMKTVAELKLPINVVAVVPATENMPGGSATRPGDIIKSMSGQTVEILNTDAEGRLILCDALTYVERFDPESVIDVATLTGACVIALGGVVSGLLGNDDALAQELLQAGSHSGDRAWQLPLLEEYQEQLKSNFADMANIGGRSGGAITAASFLARFTKKFRWAHLDIAGTAWRSGKDKGATGRPVPLLATFLIKRAEKSADTKKKSRA